MKKVVITIIMFGIAIALIVGVIVPIAGQARNTGAHASGNAVKVDNSITSLEATIN